MIRADAATVADIDAANRRHDAELYAYIRGLIAGRANAGTVTLACLVGARRRGGGGPNEQQTLWRYRVATDLYLRALRPCNRVRRRLQRVIAAILLPCSRGATQRTERWALDDGPAAARYRALDEFGSAERAAHLLLECPGLTYAENGWVLGVSRDEVAQLLYGVRSTFLQRRGAQDQASVTGPRQLPDVR